MPMKTFLNRILIIIILAFLIAGYSLGVILPPRPRNMPITIERGMSAEQIADLLKGHGIIRSNLVFIGVAYLGKLENKLSAGKFIFNEPVSTFEVLAKLTHGQKEVTVVIPEGFTVKDIARLLEKENLVNAQSFINVANESFLNSYPRGLEGFLFPDTYRFFEITSPEEIIEILIANFDLKIKTLEDGINKSGRDLYSVITMASILEKEASSTEDRRIISGILWWRLDEGTLLQVDATLAYTTGRSSSELTAEDLSDGKNPYNTYQHKGLPPGPISNPGLESIRAALAPEKTSYYYYLSDKEGTIYYSRTFEEHKKNKAKYLH